MSLNRDEVKLKQNELLLNLTDDFSMFTAALSFKSVDFLFFIWKIAE